MTFKILTYIVTLFIFASLMSLASADLTEGLVSYWKLDDASGTIVDALGVNDGTNSGASYGATGIINDALDFESTESDFVNITDNPSLDFTTELTANLWIKKESAGGDYAGIFANDYSQDRSAFIIGSMTNTSLRVWSYQSGDKFSMFTPAVSVGDWHMITLVYNGTGYGGARVYIDNVLTNLATPSVSSLPQNTYGLKMGSYNGGYFDGIIDEISLYNRSLDASEIELLWGGGAGNQYPFGTDGSVTVVLNSPANNTQITAESQVFNATITPTEANITNSTLYVWLANGTLWTQQYIYVGSNETTYVPYNVTNLTAFSNYTWNYQACYHNSTGDFKNCSFAARNRSLERITYTLSGENYTAITQEGFSNPFYLNITLAPGATLNSASFFYGGTEYSATSSQTGNLVQLSRSITAPSVSTATNYSFFWQFNISNVLANSTAHNQLVNIIDIDNCAVNTHLILNYTIVDEDTRLFLNGSLENVTANYFVRLSADLTGQTYEFYNTSTSDNSIIICASNALLAGKNYRLDSEIQFSASDYVTEYYYIENDTLNTTNSPKNITLYLLAITESQEFLITYKDSNLIPVSNAIIEINRQYLAIDDYLLVEMGRTDNDGQTVGHLVLSDEIYTFNVYKDGELLATFQNVKAFCSDLLTGDCRINLEASQSTTSPSDFNYNLGVSGTWDYNNNTRLLTYQFTTTSGASKQVNLTAYLYNVSGSNVVLCTDETTAASGTLSCSIPSTYSNSTAFIKVLVNGELKQSFIFNVKDNLNDKLNPTRFILAFFLIITLPLIAVGSATMTLVMFIVGLIMASGLMLVDYGGFIGPFSSFLWFIIAALILLIKAQSRRQNQ